MKVIINSFGLLCIAIAVMSCTEQKKAETATMDYAEVLPPALQNATPTKKVNLGEEVPHHLVCMVNDMYMGIQQLAVEHNGKTYYGCCEMCQTRIPQDIKVRKAIDPYSLKTVDKAEAYIVRIGKQGQVAYFENKENYALFIKEAAN